jgi:hypothetical protein
MLSQLAGSFSMENMGGAGQAYAQNIRDYNAPELDANDEGSLLARQRWAQSNGYQDEANQLGVALGSLREKNQGMANKREFAGMSSTMDQMRGQRTLALAGKTPEEQAIINQNFDRAQGALQTRINETASGIDGMTGIEGNELARRSNVTRAMESALINNGLANLSGLAPELTPETLSALLKNKQDAKNIDPMGHPTTYRNAAKQFILKDGTAMIVPPGGGKPISAVDDPEAYEAAAAEAVASGLEHDTAKAAMELGLEEKHRLRDTARTAVRVATENSDQIQQMTDVTQQTLMQIESGKLDTGLIQGALAKFLGVGTEQMGEMNANQVYTTLMNLGITKLTPVTEKELAMVARLWADPSSYSSMNKGALTATLNRLNRFAADLDTQVSYSIEDLRASDSSVLADQLEGRWASHTNRSTTDVVSGGKSSGETYNYADKNAPRYSAEPGYGESLTDSLMLDDASQSLVNKWNR